MTTCAAATAACGPGAKMNLAYTTGPFSVPNCPARPSRTTEGLILYGAMGGRRHRTASGSSLKPAAAGCEPFSPNRLTPAPCNSGSGPGTMVAGAREQAASCDAFVLSRRLPAPDALPIRTSPAGLIAKAPSNPRRTTACCLGRDCRSEFRQARSRTPAPDGVLAVVGMTDGVWQGGSVMSTPRREPCRTSRHDRG